MKPDFEWTLDRLRHFVAVADCGGMTAAARSLGRAQSAVSMSIALLEADLGLELFERINRNLQITPAGEVMLAEARELLAQAQALDIRAQVLARGQPAKLAVAIDEALPCVPVAQLFVEMAERHPGIELSTLCGSSNEVANYVMQQRVQIAFQIDRGAALPDCAQHFVSTVPQKIYVSQNHPLAVAGHNVSCKALAAHRQIAAQIDGMDESIISPQVWRFDSSYMIADMVAAGVGWAILPENVAHYVRPVHQLVELHCEEMVMPPLVVRLLWRQGTSLNETAKWMQLRLTQLLNEE
ncbi:LysR family transcriptional regulator [Diaphorobacter sp. HDW4A]|uniref:LysR family transcriptional regulator n=1 Tax=Diaphorobacter sp. HDW4A TaxID=2714924 RepID=UPI001407C02F|nr:LysR family transcriptional regulator [Diaphorobacter sp. HDW4A]QIL79525.1 LysR family transcriptional regulator [Diaphorobacter sp. HDW4A]